ncbi:MAG: 1-acyl-sn-glycerol-3-phosphate acyltransferase [Planctomycetota bacterium]|nr:MAG: 1-acyl-sn-glycerol-3-phosphate acyltransferase [Planctomycetota bacterium]
MEHIPSGPKIYVQNHITSTDPHWVLPLLPEPVHIIIGPGYQSPTVARLLDYLEQINALPEHRKTVVEQAVRYIQQGESIYTAPEGDIQPVMRLGRFFPGVARIYRRTGVPIVPIALHAPPERIRHWPRLDIRVADRVYECRMLLRGPFWVRIGRPLRPALRTDVDESDDNRRIMDEVKQTLADLLDEIRGEATCPPG